jgi:hypothetical protein
VLEQNERNIVPLTLLSPGAVWIFFRK